PSGRTPAGPSAASAASGSAPARPPAGSSSWRTPDRQEVAVRRHLGGPHHGAAEVLAAVERERRGPPILAGQQELGDRVPAVRPHPQALLDGLREPAPRVPLEQPQHPDVLPPPLP